MIGKTGALVRGAATALLVTLPVSAQTTWFVDVGGTPPGTGTPADPYTSIQFAISQAATVDGDTLFVLSGVYLETVDLLGKDLILQSQDGPEATTIDGGSAGSVVTLTNGETAAIDGFTITGGTGTPTGPTTPALGGGIRCAGAILSIQDCRILANAIAGFGQGGGIHAAAQSSLTVAGCEISTNEASLGAGIYLEASSASLSNCTIASNFADSTWVGLQGGGGICAADGSALELGGCTVTGNVVISGDGGGLLIDSSSAEITDCQIVFNDGGGATLGVTIGEGGGVFATADSAVQITGCDISDNWGDKGGGGIYGSASLTGCTISRNRGQFGGGAYAVDLTLTDCVISDNGGSSSGSFDFGGGIYVKPGGNAVCVDSTIQGNSINGWGGGGHGGVYLGCIISGNAAGPYPHPSQDGGGGVYLGTLEDCVIFGNRIRSGSSFPGKGGGVDRCHLERCILFGNRADHLGAAAGNSTLIHCTVFGNTAGVRGGAVYNDSGAAAILNSILWRNDPDEIAVEGGSIGVTYSDVGGGWPGVGNLDTDPLLWNSEGDDFHLLPGSPCIDAGSPMSPLDPDGSIADMGALTFDPSYCPAPSTYCMAGLSASGCQATIAATGYVLTATGVEGGKDGLFYFGANGKQAVPWGSSTSFQCVAPPVVRTPLLAGTGTSGACDGAFAFDLEAHWAAKPATYPGPGVMVQAQLWYRDPANTSNQRTSLSDAVELATCF